VREIVGREIIASEIVVR